MTLFDLYVPVSWPELIRRTAREFIDDDCLGLAAQLAYYFFLAVFPAMLFLVALASYFPLINLTDEATRWLRPFAPRDVIQLIQAQLVKISESEDSGLLTLGLAGALWSSSTAMTAVIGALNRAYDIEEGRPWWKVRLTGILLTIALSLFLVLSFTGIVAGPRVIEIVNWQVGLGPLMMTVWNVIIWPVAFALVTAALAMVYYFAPDAEQEWVWITPGSLVGTVLWLLASYGFRFYVTEFGNYNETYGAIGAVIVLLLWFYVSGLAILIGAELNAEIEHASPQGKAPGEKVAGERKRLGRFGRVYARFREW